MKNMRHEYRFDNGDTVLSIFKEYPPEIGDIIFYELSEKDKEVVSEANWDQYRGGMEGIIVSKFTDLSDDRIVWLVSLDTDNSTNYEKIKQIIRLNK